MPNFRPHALTTAALASALLVGCSSAGSEEAGEEAAQTRAVTTDQGEVTVPADPQNVVVLNSALAGYFFALDVPVAATLPQTPGPAGADYLETWAEEAEADGTEMLPWGEDGFNFEAVLAQEPDLIVGGGQGFPAAQAVEAYDRLGEIAPTVLVSSDLDTWQEQLSFIAGDLLEVPDREAELLAGYDARVEEVAAAVDVPEAPVEYVVMTSDGTPFTLPEEAGLPQTLAEVGFEPLPVAEENPDMEAYGTGDSIELSTELVAEVFTAPSAFVLSFNDDLTSVAELSENPVYAALPAFEDGNAHDLPYWSYRADYYRTMDLLDLVEEQFS